MSRFAAAETILQNRILRTSLHCPQGQPVPLATDVWSDMRSAYRRLDGVSRMPLKRSDIPSVGSESAEHVARTGTAFTIMEADAILARDTPEDV